MRVSWMQWVFLGLGLLGLAGCDETQTQSQTIEGCGVSASNGDGGQGGGLPLVIGGGGAGGTGGIVLPDPCAPYTGQTFPSAAVGDVFVVCSQCSDTCGNGDSCTSYGATCDFGGMPGICTGCCEGGLAELRCTKL